MDWFQPGTLRRLSSYGRRVLTATINAELSNAMLLGGGVGGKCMKDKDEHAKFIPHTTPLGVIWHTAPPAGGFTFFRDED